MISLQNSLKTALERQKQLELQILELKSQLKESLDKIKSMETDFAAVNDLKRKLLDRENELREKRQQEEMLKDQIEQISTEQKSLSK